MKLYKYLYTRRWDYVAIIGAFLMIFCSKQIFASEAYFYENINAESKMEFLKTAQTFNVSTFMFGYTLEVNYNGKWLNDEFDTSYNSKPHVLAHWSTIREQDKAIVIQTINNLC